MNLNDEEIPSPSTAAAWLALGAMPIERLPWWAAQWIADGHQGQALYELAGLDHSDPRAIHDLLPAALADMKISPPPTDLAAAEEVFRTIARLHAEGKLSELQVAHQVDRVLTLTQYTPEIIELPLGQLIDVSDAWDADWGPSIDELIDLVRRQCSEQLTERPQQ